MTIDYRETNKYTHRTKECKESFQIPVVRSSHVPTDCTRMHIAKVKTLSPSLLHRTITEQQKCLTATCISSTVVANNVGDQYQQVILMLYKLKKLRATLNLTTQAATPPHLHPQISDRVVLSNTAPHPLLQSSLRLVHHLEEFGLTYLYSFHPLSPHSKECCLIGSSNTKQCFCQSKVLKTCAQYSQ
jgi:hypothetical protein